MPAGHTHRAGSVSQMRRLVRGFSPMKDGQVGFRSAAPGGNGVGIAEPLNRGDHIFSCPGLIQGVAPRIDPAAWVRR